MYLTYSIDSKCSDTQAASTNPLVAFFERDFDVPNLCDFCLVARLHHSLSALWIDDYYTAYGNSSSHNLDYI